MSTTCIELQTLKNNKQLRKFCRLKLVDAGFTDERENCFKIEFKTRNGMYRDLMIYFDMGDFPLIYVSKPFTYGNCKGGIVKNVR